MSIGRNKGSKSSSTTKESNQQTTNYGAGDTLALSTGDAESIEVESLDDDVVKRALDSSDRTFDKSLDFVGKNFSELVNYAEQESVRDDKVLAQSLETVQGIAKDKAVGVQRSQRMAMYGVGGVVVLFLLMNGTGNRKATS